MIPKRLSFLALLFAGLMTLFVASQAYAHLMITPMRFVFEGKTRSHTLLLLSGDTKTRTYRLGWKLMKMDELGQYHDLPLDAAGTNSVPRMVVFSPRTVTLAGGGRQNVRLSLRKPAELPAGEYRGHLLFEDITDETSAGTANPENPSIKLNIKLGFTVPVIVRSGEIKPGAVAIANPKTQPGVDGGAPTLQLDLSHTPGQGSVYGQVVVKSSDEKIGIMSNVALYPEMSKRTVNVPLTRPLSSGSSVMVSYEGDGEFKGKTLAQKQVIIQ